MPFLVFTNLQRPEDPLLRHGGGGAGVGYPGQASHRRPRNWSPQGEREHGEFSYQPILDDGAQEVLVMLTADDGEVLRDLFHDADTIYWDTEREVLIFGKID